LTQIAKDAPPAPARRIRSKSLSSRGTMNASPVSTMMINSAKASDGDDNADRFDQPQIGFAPCHFLKSLNADEDHTPVIK
jgi:hypothetical protein